MADRRRIVQVLHKLFSHAARNAPESTPIRVAAVREDTHVAVSVSEGGDRGGTRAVAVPVQQARPGGAARAAKAGHGRGLAISKRIVEAHGRRIRAMGAGSGCSATFTFTLPAAGEAAAPPAARPGVAPAAPEPGEPPRILVVDDDPRALRFVRDALSEAGYARSSRARRGTSRTSSGPGGRGWCGLT